MAYIKGTPKNDRLSGTSENDRIIGGWGVDTVTGGAGDDRFLGSFGFGSFEQNTHIVTDFNPGDTWSFANSYSSTISAKIYSLDNNLYIDARSIVSVSRLIFQERGTIKIGDAIMGSPPTFDPNFRLEAEIEAIDPNTISPLPLESLSTENKSAGMFQSFERGFGRFQSFEEGNKSLEESLKDLILPPNEALPIIKI